MPVSPTLYLDLSMRLGRLQTLYADAFDGMRLGHRTRIGRPIAGASYHSVMRAQSRHPCGNTAGDTLHIIGKLLEMLQIGTIPIIHDDVAPHAGVRI